MEKLRNKDNVTLNVEAISLLVSVQCLCKELNLTFWIFLERVGGIGFDESRFDWVFLIDGVPKGFR